MTRLLKNLFKATMLLPLIMLFVPIFGNYENLITLLCNHSFNPIFLLIILPYLLCIAMYVISYVFKITTTIKIIEFGLGVVALILFSFSLIFYDIGTGLEVGDTTAYFTFYILIALSIIIVVYWASFLLESIKFSVSEIVEIGILVALAIVLDITGLKIKLHNGGGSISFIMIPLFIIALRRGFVKGFIANGIVFGLISCLYDGYGFHTFPLDYFLGFGAIAVAGFFNKFILPNDNNKFTIKGVAFLILSIVASVTIRLFCSTLSGNIFYGVTFIESLIINAPDMLLSGGITIIALTLLYKPLLIINKLFPVR